jgi:uncharacterized protein (DUF1501 family)
MGVDETILSRRLPMSPLTRRQFLRVGAFGTAFTLADQLRAADLQKAATKSARAKSAIMIFLPGGPPHLDTWDPKPDAPSEFRGEFGSIATSAPGVRFIEHFPLQAKLFDKLAILRSVVGMSEEHADVQIQTGYTSTIAKAGRRPSFGAVVSKQRGWGQGLPPFVSLRGLTTGSEPGFLGIAHRPFSPGGDEADSSLRLSAAVPVERLDERKALLAAFDGGDRKADASGSMAGMDSFQQQAFEMITSGKIREALSLKRESEEALERYSSMEVLLKARRLVEAGVRCVTVSLGSWDTHKDNFKSLKDMLPQVDQGISTLVQDLHDRGLGDDVVVLAWGEFGRTPKVNAQSGRDHWTPVMSALIAGGGLKMGQIIGSSDRRGEQPKEKPYSVQQVLATVYKAIGIDPGMTLPDANGRPVYLLDDREVIRELI